MKKKNKQNKKRLPIVSVESLCKGNLDYFLDWIDGKSEDRIEVLRKLKVSQGTVVASNREKHFCNFLNRSNFEIKLYQNAGLDLGKGDAEFGYRMPLPKPGENYRELIIFRRR